MPSPVDATPAADAIDDAPGKNGRFKKAASKLMLAARVVRAMAVKKVKLRFPNGDHYVGEMDMVKARYHGRGEFTWCNGSRYVGEWFNGKRQGDGKLFDKPNKKYSNKQSVYIGEFRNNKREGQGRFERGRDARM